MSRLQSPWLARKIRKRQHRRSRSFVAVLTAAAALLFLPLLLRQPTQVQDSIELKDVSKTELIKCQKDQHEFEPVIQKGTGTYNLEKPRGVLQATNGTSNDFISTGVARNEFLPSSWSQYGQDLWVDTYFGQKRNGIFVEVGGYDGETHSNTLFLEKERAWQGILIEANPYSYELMQQKGRSCWMAHACIESHNHSTLQFTLAGGITSAVEVASRQHADRIQHDLPQYRHQPNWRGGGEKWCMSCTPFDAILRQTSLWPRAKTLENNLVIDYFSLDVEGAEVELLQTLLDGNFPSIRLFTIEMQENAHAIRHFLMTKKYREIATVGIDSVFVLDQRP